MARIPSEDVACILEIVDRRIHESLCESQLEGVLKSDVFFFHENCRAVFYGSKVRASVCVSEAHATSLFFQSDARYSDGEAHISEDQVLADRQIDFDAWNSQAQSPANTIARIERIVQCNGAVSNAEQQ